MHPKEASENRRRALHQFSASNPLEFVSIDILRQVSKTMSSSQFVLVMTESYTKLHDAVMTSRTTAQHIPS